MPFILNVFLKMFAHGFPAGNCSIIKYIKEYRLDCSLTIKSIARVNNTAHLRKQPLTWHRRYLRTPEPPCRPQPKLSTVLNYLSSKRK